MLRRNIAFFVSFSSLLFGTAIYADSNNSSVTPSPAQPDIKVNIRGDTHHVYQGEVKSSGSQMDEEAIMSDRRIQDKIQNLIENNFRKYNINITVSQGNVVLKGYVENEETKQNIEQDVLKIQGVKKVNNLLTIKEKM